MPNSNSHLDRLAALAVVSFAGVLSIAIWLGYASDGRIEVSNGLNVEWRFVPPEKNQTK